MLFFNLNLIFKFRVDNQVKEINPHSKILNTYQIDEYDDCVDEDIHIITAPLNI